MDRSELLSFDPKYTPGHGSMTVSTYRTPNSWASDMTAIDLTSPETLTLMPCFSPPPPSTSSPRRPPTEVVVLSFDGGGGKKRPQRRLVVLGGQRHPEVAHAVAFQNVREVVARIDDDERLAVGQANVALDQGQHAATDGSEADDHQGAVDDRVDSIRNGSGDVNDDDDVGVVRILLLFLLLLHSRRRLLGGDDHGLRRGVVVRGGVGGVGGCRGVRRRPRSRLDELLPRQQRRR